MSHAEECHKYGLWRMKCLKTVCLSGRIMNEGDDFSVPGNVALNLVYGGDAEFCDDSGLKAREEKFAKEAAELGAPVNYQTAPEFQNFPDVEPIKPKRKF